MVASHWLVILLLQAVNGHRLAVAIFTLHKRGYKKLQHKRGYKNYSKPLGHPNTTHFCHW